jgi:hypothetical protein
MIKAEEGGSFYDAFGDDYVAPPMENYQGETIEKKAPLVREQNWQSANNERFKQDLPDHVREAMTVTQKDYSYYEFDNLAFNRNPRDNFGAKVNQAFGKLEKGFVFKDEKARYQKLYKQLLGEL